MSTPVWRYKTDFDNSTILKQDYFAGDSFNHIIKNITHNYIDNITEMRRAVESYVGHHIHPDTHDSKLREAYKRVKEPKFITVKEVSKILR